MKKLVIMLLSVSMLLGGFTGSGTTAEKVTPGPSGPTGSASGMPSSTVIVGSAVGSSAYEAAIAISDLVQRKIGIVATPRASESGPTGWIRMLHNKQADIAPYTQLIEARLAAKGESEFAPLGPTPLRLLRGGLGTPMGILVTRRSGVTRGEALKGKRVHFFLPSQPIMQLLTPIMLKAYGLKETDVTILTRSTTQEALDDLSSYRADGYMAALTMAKIEQANATVRGGVLLVALPTDNATMDMVSKIIGGISPGIMAAGTGVPEPTSIWRIDVAITARADISDDFAYELTKATVENGVELSQKTSAFRGWGDKSTAIPLRPTIPFHPGAVKYYKEIGLWTEQMEKVQAGLLAEYK